MTDLGAPESGAPNADRPAQPSAVFACCVRSAEAFLPAVLRNLETMAALYQRPAFIFVENDSEDATKGLLKAWIAERADAWLIDLDGLSAHVPNRTERLAVCRNAYLEAIVEHGYGDRTHLVVIDGDEVNERPIAPEDVRRARDWLESHDDAAAVFSNPSPIYYDILALRRPLWCPDDFWGELRRESGRLGKEEARRRFRDDRQVPIDRAAAPIEVESAFGGLGIYKLARIDGARYAGLTADGEETCEHVGFNRAVGRTGKLFILPWLQTGFVRSLGVALPAARQIVLRQGEASCSLTGPADHPLQELRERHPLYDRRLPLLAKLLSDAAPGGWAIDVGANIGDTVALCRLHGCELHFVAAEASLDYVKFLLRNRLKRPELFRSTEVAWAFVGRPGDSGVVAGARGTASSIAGPPPEPSPGVAQVLSLQDLADRFAIAPAGLALVKLDTDGHDQAILLNDLDFLRRAAPVLWTEAQVDTPEQEADWRRVLESAADAWPQVVVFDNFGFAYAAGATREKLESCLDLISYARRHRGLKASQFDRPTIYYPDIALFPERFAGVFEAFRVQLPELAP